MRERMVAWAEDCRVDGEVDLEDGRVSDQVNGLELLTFYGATLEAIEDGHHVAMDEVEVARRELSLIEVEGRRGDPARRLRTIAEPVMLEVGPFVVTGKVHRSPTSPPLVALERWSRFLPVTDALVEIPAAALPERASHRHDVLLVNRDRVGRYRAVVDPAAAPMWIPESEATPAVPDAPA